MPEISPAGQESVRMLVGFHDGYLTGVRSAPSGDTLLWLSTAARIEYLVLVPRVSRLWLSSFTGSNVISAILLYESKRAPRDLLSTLWGIDASSDASTLDAKIEAFAASERTLVEVATSDGCSLIAEFKGTSDLIQIWPTDVRICPSTRE